MRPSGAAIGLRREGRRGRPRNFDHLILGIKNPVHTPNNGLMADSIVTFTESGFFGYYCDNHGDPDTGEGMGAVIWVVDAF